MEDDAVPDAPEHQLATSLERVLSDLLRGLLTEPMPIFRLAYWFKVGRHRMTSTPLTAEQFCDIRDSIPALRR